MLRAMSELEKAVNDLLDRLQNRPGTSSEWERAPSREGDEGAPLREREAAELIQRAIKRLKSL